MQLSVQHILLSNHCPGVCDFAKGLRMLFLSSERQNRKLVDCQSPHDTAISTYY
jgi:hypothetical protein